MEILFYVGLIAVCFFGAGLAFFKPAISLFLLWIVVCNWIFGLLNLSANAKYEIKKLNDKLVSFEKGKE